VSITVLQIHYDEATRASLDPAFMPLDNSQSEHPEWYEFWPMLSYLRQNGLPRYGDWLGFLSPRFTSKTGVTGEALFGLIQNLSHEYDALIVSHQDWDQIAYFQNSFEQADHWHPDLSKYSQDFLDHAGVKLDIRSHVGTANNTIFCNYIIAKADYWAEWQEMAEKLLAYVRDNPHPSAAKLRGRTSYVSETNQVPARAFIQERLANIILANDLYRVAFIDAGLSTPTNDVLFADTGRNRKLLNTLNVLKQEYLNTRDTDYLDMFHKLRAAVEPIQKLNLWSR
jgi:hypothetical protein